MDEVVSAILANAERLLLDAKILRSHNSFDTTVSLAILSVEESSKACLVYWKRSGILKRDISRDIRAGHINKQRVFGSYHFVRAAIDASVFRDSGELISKDEITDELIERAAKAGYEAGHKKRFYADSGLLDYMKQTGFYVDVNEQLQLMPTFGRAKAIDADGRIKDAEDAIRMANSEHRFHCAMAATYELLPNVGTAKDRAARISAALLTLNQQRRKEP